MRAGLQGCGIQSQTALPGASFNLTFMVFDNSMPAASATFTKTISIISPCAPGKVFCRGMAPLCGEGPCSLRQRADSAAPAEPEFAIDISQLPAGSARYTPDGVEVMAVCGAPLPVVLPVCRQADSALGCLARAAPRTAVLQQRVRACSLQDAESGNCTLCSAAALRRRMCSASEQHFAYENKAGSNLQAVAVTVTEAVGRLRAAFEVAASGLNGTSAANFANYSAAHGPLAAAMSAAAWTAIPESCGAGTAGAAVGFMQHTDLALSVTVDETAPARFSGGSAELRVNATLTLGVALRGRPAAEVHSAAPAGAAHACLAGMATGALNASSINAALAALHGSAPQPVRVTSWQALGTEPIDSSNASACTDLGAEELQELWLEASSDALAAEMELLDIQVRSLLLLLTSLVYKCRVKVSVLGCAIL